MNIDTGELRRMNDVSDELLEAFKEVPDYLRDEANEILEGNESAMVDLDGTTGLAQWARHHRTSLTAQKKRTKNKTAKRSRKTNRHK